VTRSGRFVFFNDRVSVRGGRRDTQEFLRCESSANVAGRVGCDSGSGGKEDCTGVRSEVAFGASTLFATAPLTPSGDSLRGTVVGRLRQPYNEKRTQRLGESGDREMSAVAATQRPLKA
jgi:hypothetical protein